MNQQPSQHTQQRTRDWIRLCLVSLIGMIIVLSAVGTIYDSAFEREHEFHYLSEVLDKDPEYHSVVDWDLTQKTAGRDFTKPDAVEAGKALTMAWHRLLLGQRSGNKEFLRDHFDGPALKKAMGEVAKQRDGTDRGLVVFRQKSRPRIFHNDGSIIELISDEVLVSRYVIDEKQDKIKLLSLSRECTRQILAQDIMGWKVRNHETDCADPINLYERSPDRRKIKFPLKGVNYYPANTPWHEFWSEFEEETVKSDLSLIKGLGANSVRIFIPFKFFSGERTFRTGLARLKLFLSMAAEKEISVIPTLFDFQNSYEPNGWSEEYDYMRNVIEVVRQHKNVQLIDLKNEPDLDYALVGKARVNAWLIVFSGLLKNLAPELSVTVGWLGHEPAAAMADLVDVVSYHEYGDPDKSAGNYNRVKSLAKGKPVILSEIGKPSWSLAATLPFSENSQAKWLRDQLINLTSTDGVFVWTLHDFDYKDTSMVARLPWRRSMQASFGLYNRKGVGKPAAKIFRNFQMSPPTADKRS